MMEQMVKFPFSAAGAGCKPSALPKAFPHTVSWAKDHFELRELENKWLIQLFISHLVHVIYFDPFWHVHHPFIGICSCTCALKIGLSPASKNSCVGSSQPVLLLSSAVPFLHEAMDFPIRLQMCTKWSRHLLGLYLGFHSQQMFICRA